MPDSKNWEQFRDNHCKIIESDLLGFTVQKKERLISAVMSNARLNEPLPLSLIEMYECRMDPSLQTIGDYVLNFAIFDNFSLKGHHTKKVLDDYRQKYGRNENLQNYAKNYLRLQNYILWGQDEIRLKKWDQPTTTILADRFEMLIAIIYFEKGLIGIKSFLETKKFFEEIDKL